MAGNRSRAQYDRPRDLDDPGSLVGKVRRPGSGRPALTSKDTTLLEDLRQLLEPATMGDPMRPLRWVSKSHAKLAAALCAMGHQIAKSSRAASPSCWTCHERRRGAIAPLPHSTEGSALLSRQKTCQVI